MGTPAREICVSRAVDARARSAGLDGHRGVAVIRHRLSMRRSLALIVFVMGLLAMLLVFAGGEFYRDIALDAQRDALAEFLRAETNRLHDAFDARTSLLVQRVRNDAAFSSALAAREPALLTRELNNLYRSSKAIPANPRIGRLYVLDEKSRALGASSSGEANADADVISPPCAASAAHTASIFERGRGAKSMCLVDDHAYYVAAAALGAGRGYLYVAVDLVSELGEIERQLGAPMRLSRDGSVLYQSALWPQDESASSVLLARTSLLASVPKPAVLQLSAAKDISAFVERSARLRVALPFGVALVTALATWFALLALDRVALTPLRRLTIHLRRIREDKRNLGEPVPVGGNAEVAALAEGFNDMTARLRESYENLERMAFTDALTGLPNRSLFLDRLQQAILTAKREVKPFALLMMDLDRFKDINDTLGHQIGDLLLTQVAQRLRSKLRASDTVARMGGDEFAVLLPAADAKHAGMASRMLLQALRSPFAVEEHNLGIGASLGIALYPEHGVDASALMQRADVAMYSAKSGGSGFAFYDSAADQNYPTRLALLSDLRQAVEQEQFELYYQPIVSLVNNRVAGIEALARWRHPRDGMVMPDSFIPLLEQSGLIRGLMPWVVSEALKRAHALQMAGSPLTVSINLSMRDLQDPYIVESFAEQLEAYQVAAGSIVLEITESAVMTDAPRTLELLTRLSGMGLKIAIDDFGTGYSSLTYLKKLPVNTLKIDKSFVIGMQTDENDAAIVRTSIDLAHNLGLKVVAEGVESEAALNQLKLFGCDCAQGHYVSRPLSHTDLENWLQQSSWGVEYANRLVSRKKRLSN